MKWATLVLVSGFAMNSPLSQAGDVLDVYATDECAAMLSNDGYIPFSQKYMTGQGRLGVFALGSLWDQIAADRGEEPLMRTQYDREAADRFREMLQETYGSGFFGALNQAIHIAVSGQLDPRLGTHLLQSIWSTEIGRVPLLTISVSPSIVAPRIVYPRLERQFAWVELDAVRGLPPSTVLERLGEIRAEEIEAFGESEVSPRRIAIVPSLPMVEPPSADVPDFVFDPTLRSESANLLRVMLMTSDFVFFRDWALANINLRENGQETDLLFDEFAMETGGVPLVDRDFLLFFSNMLAEAVVVGLSIAMAEKDDEREYANKWLNTTMRHVSQQSPGVAAYLHLEGRETDFAVEQLFTAASFMQSTIDRSKRPNPLVDN